MPVFLPARLYFMSVRDTISPPTTDVTRILQFIPQLKEVGEFLFFFKSRDTGCHPGRELYIKSKPAGLRCYPHL